MTWEEEKRYNEGKRSLYNIEKFEQNLNSGKYSFLTISASRSENTGEINNKLTFLLRKTIADIHSFDYNNLIGSYYETVEDKKVKVEERSFLVWAKVENEDRLFNFGKEMCYRFKQECFGFISSSNNMIGLYNEAAKNIFDKDNTLITFDAVNFYQDPEENLEKVYSILRNKKFEFISLEDKLEESSGYFRSLLLESTGMKFLDYDFSRGRNKFISYIKRL